MAKIKAWGFLRETKEAALSSGIDKDTGMHRTGLDEYLKIIFPNVKDWIHDKIVNGLVINGKQSRCRPDYRSEKLKMIIEFDGLQHYKIPETIQKDIKNTRIYKEHGYTVVRIPYFIQLTNEAVKTLFGVNITKKLFDGAIPSLGVQGKNTPAYLCPAGVKRMAEEFRNFPEQYHVNINFLTDQNDPIKTGIEFLEEAYKKLP